MVQLKVVTEDGKVYAIDGFNSNMVQLKGCNDRIKELLTQFQFQYGTIKS